MLITQTHIYEIIIDAISGSLCKNFSKIMESEFEMSMMSEFIFFSWIAN